jgi:hypothetical protein
VVVGDDAHGHPHGLSMKKILMSSTLCDEPHSTKNLEVWALQDVLVGDVQEPRHASFRVCISDGVVLRAHVVLKLVGWWCR